MAWLDARSHNGRFILRLEDLDTTRLRPGQRESMIFALEWLGLDWDELQLQSELSEQHEQALDSLAADGRLYPCSCSRKSIKGRCTRAPDNSFAYDNLCQVKALPASGWRECPDALRVRLPSSSVELVDESGLDLSQCPASEMGDPIVVRRDGAYAYHLVVVVDDAQSGVTRVVRGRDLATSTATQVQLYELLGLPLPSYRHHMLLMENAGEKFAKLHKSLPFEEIREAWSPTEMCGLLAKLCGLQSESSPCTPSDLLADFHWNRIRTSDRLFPLF